MSMATAGYDDGTIRCDDHGITIRRSYPWGSKTIPYASIKGTETLALTGANQVRRWRIWGSGDFVHWWNFDPHRPKKDTALVLDSGRRVRPTITPDDAAAAARIITAHRQGRWGRTSPR
ncbi:hypothetical protein [Streptomyces misionensis]|uniref:hypothetical protein n=1 Tax=Streptomyces misionensis TaxID=67331 RepID=UPI00340CEB0D